MNKHKQTEKDSQLRFFNKRMRYLDLFLNQVQSLNLPSEQIQSYETPCTA